MVIIPHDPSHSQRVHCSQSLCHRQTLRPNPRHRVSPRQQRLHHYHHHQQVGLQTHLVTTERKQIQAIFNSVQLPFFYSTTFPLQIRASSGSSTLLKSGTVLPIKIHRDEENGKILNLVFVWADKGSKLKVDAPTVFKGEDVCPGLKKGGTLNRIRTTLKYICPAEHIPSKIEVDISNLDIEDKVFMHDIKVHPSLKLLIKYESIPICKVVAMTLENSKPAL